MNGLRLRLSSKASTCSAVDQGSIPGLGRSPGEGNGNHSSILAWEIPWTEEPGTLQSMGFQRVKHDSDYIAARVLSKSIMPVCNQQIQTKYRLNSKSLIWRINSHNKSVTIIYKEILYGTLGLRESNQGRTNSKRVQTPLEKVWLSPRKAEWRGLLV